MASAVKKFVPLMDRVLVQIAKAETKTASGIYLPEATKQSINQATVSSLINIFIDIITMNTFVVF